MRRPVLTAIAALVTLASLPMAAGCSAKLGIESPKEGPPVARRPDGTPATTHLVVTQPLEGALLGSRLVMVTGDTDATEVTVNDEVVEVVDGKFETAVRLDEGAGRVLVLAGDASQSINVTVDGTAPVVTITSPTPASFIEGDVLLIEGRVEDAHLDTLEIDGISVSLAADGSFRQEREVEPAAFRIRVVATDAVGHAGYGFTSAIVGEFAPAGERLDSAARLEIGSGAIGTLVDAAEPLISPANVRPLIMNANPVVSEWWGDIHLTGENHGAVNASAVTGVDRITATVRIADINVPLLLDPSVGPNITGTATVTSAVGTLVANVGAAGGRPTVTIASSSVVLNGFRVDVDGLPSGADTLVTNLVRNKVQSSIESVVRAQVPPVISDALTRIPLSHTITLLGHTAEVSGAVRSFTTTSAGLRGVFDLGIEATSVDSSMMAGVPGSLVLGARIPPTGTPSSVRAAVSLDVVNQALFAGWSTGLLEIEIADPQVGSGPLTVGALSLLAPDLRGRAASDAPVSLFIDAVLPPVVQPTEDGLFEVIVPDLHVTATAEGTELFVLSVSLRGDVRIAIEDNEIAVHVADTVLVADAVGAPNGLPEGPALDRLLEGLVGPLLEDYTSLEGLRVPQLFGFEFSDYSASLDRGYLVVEGSLRQAR
jgi:hypothetical protein